ncbi:hypothetical protein LCGC14_1931750 [marine sediment metagenome]|uniref:L-threonylcarbamoyladenylate synthase n=1 Tax=marine sediment metagenome TaxID=412755 RepID=A0A0F9I1M3_9ZZZZ
MATRIIKVDPDQWTAEDKASRAALTPAVRAIRAGKLVAFPTETVYGVGVVATDAGAVGRLRDLKARPKSAFTVHLASPADAMKYVEDVPMRARTLMAKAWPGPVTILLPTGGRFADPSLRSGALYRRMVQDDVVGLRCPRNPIARDLLARAGEPVLATSANLAGKKAPADAEGVLKQLSDRVDVLVDSGPTRYRKGSTIVAFEGEDYRVIRSGVYDAGAVARLMRRRILFVCTGNTCRSPMAAALARKLLAERLGCPPEKLTDCGQEVVSAGTFGFSGARATGEAVAAAEKRGAELSRHRSRKLTTELINASDLVFCMTGRHVAEVSRRADGAAAKTYRLDPGGDIADPIGAGVDIYVQVADRIEAALRERMRENLL